MGGEGGFKTEAEHEHDHDHNREEPFAVVSAC